MYQQSIINIFIVYYKHVQKNTNTKKATRYYKGDVGEEMINRKQR